MNEYLKRKKKEVNSKCIFALTATFSLTGLLVC